MIKRLALLNLILCLLRPDGAASASNLPHIQTVFIILLENADWAQVYNNASAPYLNQTILPQASFCNHYLNVPDNHPSEPNYLWLECGTNFGLYNDDPPAVNHQGTTNHLVTLLNRAGISWKAYAEGIDGNSVPLTDTNEYAPKHCPFVFFDVVTGTNNPSYPYGIAHIRPYDELAGDLSGNSVARYNFIIPNLCDDAHDTCAPVGDNLRQADNWLTTEIRRITNSSAYKNDGAIFITWDESGGGNVAIGMIVLSPLAKGGGYQNSISYTHSSTLRTFQEIFNVIPFLGDAANATDLSDLFVAPVTIPPGFRVNTLVKLPGGAAQLTITGATPGKTNLLQWSANLGSWSTFATNVVVTNNYSLSDPSATNANRRYYRAVQLP